MGKPISQNDKGEFSQIDGIFIPDIRLLQPVNDKGFSREIIRGDYKYYKFYGEE